MSAEVMIGAWLASYSHWDAEKINRVQILTTPPLLFRRWRFLKPLYAARRKGSFFSLFSRASIHKLCVNTPQATANSRRVNPLLASAAPKNPAAKC